jgi:hypothetical protein
MGQDGCCRGYGHCREITDRSGRALRDGAVVALLDVLLIDESLRCWQFDFARKQLGDVAHSVVIPVAC